MSVRTVAHSLLEKIFDVLSVRLSKEERQSPFQKLSTFTTSSAILRGVFLLKKALDKKLITYYSSIVMKLSNYSKIFKALSNEQRLKIFIMLYNHCCLPKKSIGGSKFKMKGDNSYHSTNGSTKKAFTKICDCMNLSKSTISHHFRELQNAGLISCKKEGQIYSCKVNEEMAGSIKEFFK